MISIIIPVYNTEAFLAKTVDSILSQRFTDYELLLIDDGSKDSSGEICDRYANLDQRIRVFHTQNNGAAAARNIGLDHATGEWVYFVDSDDILMPDCLQTLDDGVTDDVDVVVAKYDGDDAVTHIPYETIVRADEMLCKVLKPRAGSYYGNVGDKMFRCAVIEKNQIRFCENIYFGEDRLFITEYLCCSSRHVKMIARKVYQYTQHCESTLGKLANGYDQRYATDVDSSVLSKTFVYEYTQKYNSQLTFLQTFKVRYAALWLICESAIRNIALMKRHNTINIEAYRHIMHEVRTSGAYPLYHVKYLIKRILHPRYFR